eukprot:scaffold114275_cov63-Phaeocystis_antarctica.AAC.3
MPLRARSTAPPRVRPASRAAASVRAPVARPRLPSRRRCQRRPWMLSQRQRRALQPPAHGRGGIARASACSPSRSISPAGDHPPLPSPPKASGAGPQARLLGGIRWRRHFEPGTSDRGGRPGAPRRWEHRSSCACLVRGLLRGIVACAVRASSARLRQCRSKGTAHDYTLTRGAALFVKNRPLELTPPLRGCHACVAATASSFAASSSKTPPNRCSCKSALPQRQL